MIRVGLGYDLHRLVKNRKLIIGGIEFDFELGEDGHSDGDVLLHAITDALLGAAGISDIGELFPPNDDKWKGADSAKLLQEAYKLVKAEGWKIENIDCVIQLEKPKFLPKRKEVCKNIAKILQIEENQVFVKAKTGEKLFPIGTSEAINAQVVCLLSR